MSAIEEFHCAYHLEVAHSSICNIYAVTFTQVHVMMYMCVSTYSLCVFYIGLRLSCSSHIHIKDCLERHLLQFRPTIPSRLDRGSPTHIHPQLERFLHECLTLCVATQLYALGLVVQASLTSLTNYVLIHLVG